MRDPICNRGNSSWMPEMLHNVQKEMDAESELKLEIIRQSSTMGERTKNLRRKKVNYERIKFVIKTS